jgi:hypothetical protein
MSREVVMTMDPEVQAMSKIAEALADLEEPARERVLRWAKARYTASGNVVSTEEAKTKAEEADTIEFDHLSELFDAVEPSTEFEKVLVASYWFQEIKGQPYVRSLTVNKALKQLGHGIGNITREFTRLQDEKPSLIIQVQKKGSTKQARKQYKVTAAGKRRIENMVSGIGD